VYLQSTGGLTPVTVLLNTYRHFHEKLTNGKQSQKKVWASIAAVLIKKGYGVFCCDIACKVIKLADFFLSIEQVCSLITVITVHCFLIDKTKNQQLLFFFVLFLLLLFCDTEDAF